MPRYEHRFIRDLSQTAIITVEAPDSETAEAYAAAELDWADWENEYEPVPWLEDQWEVE